MDAKELEHMVERYQRLADKNAASYQETGVSQYDWRYRNYQDVADAARQALTASDDHMNCVYLKGTIMDIGKVAQDAVLKGDHEKALRLIVRMCKDKGFFATI